MIPTEIEAYFEAQPDHIKAILEKIRQAIKEAVPQATELISYQMPAFKFHGMVAWYAPFKRHYSLFIRPQFIEVFKDDLKQYEKSKGGIRFPMDHPVPVELVAKIAAYVAKVNIENIEIKSVRKKK